MATDTKKPFQKSPLKIPPQDTPAEQALLGAIMIKPESINDIVDTIRPESFYSLKHRIIFKAMLTLYEKSEPIDLVSLRSILQTEKKLEQVGGATYLSELISKKSALRKLIESADNILELGYNESETLDSILDQSEKIIFGLTNFTKKTYTNIKDTLSDAWDRFDKLNKSKEGIRGVPTGF